ncbi:MAG TPA: hypothetical protein PK322_11530 [Opitutaceae bacterium]|nr:hypothetical protein [Opitutaceae bacterium]
MKLRRWLLLPVLVLASLPILAADPVAPAPPAPPAAAEEPTPHQKLYYFEHRLLPKWTHGTQGAFFEDLLAGKVERLQEAAREIVGPEFAAALTVEVVEAPAGVLVTFAAPAERGDCYFAFIAKVGEGYRFFTYEKAMSITGRDIEACIAEWGEDGGHRNFGFRSDKAREEFLKAVAGLLVDTTIAPNAVTRPGAARAE